MLNKTKLYWISQILGWLVYVLIAGFFNLLNNNQLNADLVYSLLSIYLIGLTISHVYRIIIIRLNWMSYSISKLIPRIFIGILVFGIVVYSIQTIVVDILIFNYDYQFSLADAFPQIINWSLLCLLWSLLYFLFHFITNYKKEEIKNLKWQAAKNEIELNKIKSQLNPHFIFNSMNSIRALIAEDPELAKTAITQLSNVLRNSLLMGNKKLIPFREEMKLVNDYLNLEKTRFEERLTIERNIEKSSEGFLVPPLMIQTIVENGIKHGTSQLPKGGIISITSKIKKEHLEIIIINSGNYDQNKPTETGFGLINTQQRLQLLYGEKASFSIANENEMVKAVIIIPKETIL